MKKYPVRLALLPLLVWAGCVGTSKSSTPLSPAIAGPIAGVGISAPSVIAPAVDALIDASAQPITLQVGNADTTGERPLHYRFEIAADPNFTSPVFNKEAVPQDPSGRTSMTLPGPLSPERKYYWHARAEDGANTGPFGATSAFNVFTPVILGAPTLLSPISGANAGTLQPRFVIGNASRSGPVGQIFYVIEVSTSGSFGALAGSWAIVETPGQSELMAPVSLSAGEYFWRARGFDGGHTGPYSGIQSFRTSGTGTGGGGGGNPGAPCGPPYPTSALGILQCRRSQYSENMSDADRVAFLKGSAQDFNAAGVAGGPFGILVKTTGANCNGYSCDILCAGNGAAQRQWDVLAGIPGSPATFFEVGAPVTVRQCDIQ